MQINHSGFYIHNIRKLAQCISLFKSEAEVRLVLCYSTGTISLTSLILANVALLQVVLRPSLIMDASTILLQTTKEVTKEPTSLYLSTIMFLRALTEATKFEATYCIIYPSASDETLMLSSFDINNREMSTFSIHPITAPLEDILSGLPPIEREDGPIRITRPARVLSDYFGTNADTEISTVRTSHLVWTTKDTLLTTQSNLYCSASDTLRVAVTQTFLKGIMVFVKQTLVFLNQLPCTLTMGPETPLHLFHSSPELTVDLISGYMVDTD
jgi:hypothetical protein